MSENILNVATIENQRKIIKLAETVHKKSIKRYTVKIDKSNPNPYNRITYMDDAVGMKPVYMNYTSNTFNYGDWGNVWFIKDNYPVMLKSDGTVDYKLNPNNYTKKEDGTASDITNVDYDGNAMSRFPKVYLSFTEDTNYEYISVCESKYDETYEPIGFINDSGNEVDEIFLAIYRGYVDDNKLRSISGYKPTGQKTGTDEITYAKANGTGWYTRTWAQRQMVNALLTIISKSDNSQEAFGMGNCDSDMIISGSLNNKGQFYGYNDKTHQVKVFHIEGWWADQFDRIAGVIVNTSGNVKVAMHGPYNTTGSGSNYKTIFTISSNIYGYGANCKCDNICGRLPISNKSSGGTSGSSSTFLCDSVYIYKPSSSTYYLIVGGEWNSGLNAGPSYFDARFAVSGAGLDVGASLSYISTPSTNSGGGGYPATGT